MVNNKFLKVKSIISKYISKDYVIAAIYITLVISLAYNPLKNVKVTSFNRVLGNAMMLGVDVTKRVNNFYFYLFFAIPILFFILYGLCCIMCYQSDDSNKQSISFLNMVSTIAFISLIVSYINKFSIEFSMLYSIGTILPACIVIIILCYLSLDRKYKNIFKFDILKWCMFASFPILLIITVLCYRINFNLNSIVVAIIYSAILITLFLSISLFQYNYKNKIRIELLQKSYLPVMLAPIWVCIFLEFANVLNQYNVFINRKIKWTFIIYSICLLQALIIFLFSRKKVNLTFKMEKWYYPISIISFVLISIQLPMQMTINTDFFESANHGVAISELFSYGKLPIIQNFDAHMLSNQIWGVLYGIINHDYFGAIFVPYSNYFMVIFFILFYYILKYFFEEDVAVLLCLLYPVLFDPSILHFSFGFVIIIGFINSYKKSSFKNYILFWIGAAVTCFYLLDVGYTFIIAAVLTWAFIYIIDRKAVDLKKLIVTCVLVVSLFLGAFVSLCIFKGVNPISRILEFLKLSMSNVNWSYSSIGDGNWIAFSLCYFFIPIVVLVLFIIIFYKTLRDKSSNCKVKFIIISMLATVYIFNITRGLVRHSLLENFISMVVSTAPLFIALGLSILCKKRKLIVFMGSYFSIILILNMTLSTKNIAPESLLNLSINKQLMFEQYSELYTQKVQRIKLSSSMENNYKPVKEIFDFLMKPNETYIDFTNDSLLYALTKREKPVYVDQSPGLLSGEDTQKMYIDEIKEFSDRATFVLMPIKNMNFSASLDGIQNSYRYYLISEYISTNYKPMVTYGNYAIWCRKDVFNKKLQLIKNSTNNVLVSTMQKTDFSYGNDRGLHSYTLKDIPYIWAQYDKRGFASKEIVCNVQNNISLDGKESRYLNVNLTKINKVNGNYVAVTATSLVDGKISIDMGNLKNDHFNQLSTFSFNLKAGENVNYLIRVSSDFYWYSDLINTIRITSDTNIKNVSTSIVKGDTLN